MLSNVLLLYCQPSGSVFPKLDHELPGRDTMTDSCLSPRGSIACVRMAKAWAYLKGRDYVLPEDVADVFMDVAKHRIVLNTKARVAHVSADAVLEEILAKVKQPASYMRKEEYRV